MQVTGTIRSVFASQRGGYQPSQGAYVYTFDMEIDTSQGIVIGEIGSKTQAYPLAVGQPIIVEVTQTDHGPRLKKINPQYANQPPQGAPPQTGSPPQTPADPSSGRFATAETTSPPQRVPSEWDKPIDWHDKKQLLIVRQSSIANAIALVKIDDTEQICIENVLTSAAKIVHFVYHGIIPGETDQPQYDTADENPPQPEDPY